MEVLEYKTTKEEAGVRIDRFLSEKTRRFPVPICRSS